MTHLLTARGVTLARGGDTLLDHVGLQVEDGERICLLGRNGSGKSTLLGILAGRIEADEGELVKDLQLRIAELPQQVPTGVQGRVHQVVASGVGDLGALLKAHHDAVNASSPEALRRMEVLQHRIEAAGAWDLDRRIARTLERLQLDAEAEFGTLSGGQARRALLARALVAEPQLLILDEPTNHLDLDTIVWLQGLMGAWRGSVVFTTHDRQLLSAVATRILELDRGQLSSWPGDYQNYLRRQRERRHAESMQRSRFDRRLAQEEVWIRQGIKARRTRNEGRVRQLAQMREQRAQRRSEQGQARFRVQSAGASGRLVLEVSGVAVSFGELPVIADLDLLVERGERIGVIGPNGSGKTTLLRVLLGELEPTAGAVRRGSKLELAYFDQHRATLDDDTSVRDSVADGRDHVSINGADRHVLGYLQEFLFPPERARSPVRSLSGGERARLLLARLFARPFNLLVMDEPTNDLDIETLELLEERLLEYSGTLILVSHDRAFLDNVVTSVLVMEGGGRVGDYVGGYSDWERHCREHAAQRQPAPPARISPARSPRTSAPRLGYNEQRELKALPERIESLENELGELHQRLADPALYKDANADIAALNSHTAHLERELEEAYARWSELESRAG